MGSGGSLQSETMLYNTWDAKILSQTGGRCGRVIGVLVGSFLGRWLPQVRNMGGVQNTRIKDATCPNNKSWESQQGNVRTNMAKVKGGR